jgi:uncharacterized protein (TIGR02145 family)
MKRILRMMLLSLVLGAVSMNGQVRIGGTTAPNVNAILDLNATDAANNATKGLALPRVALQSVNLAAPFAAHVAGMHVYNTASTSGGLDTIVQPGEYYNNGARWIKLRNAADQINSTDVSETFDTWLTIKIQNLIKTSGAITNNCQDTVRGIDFPVNSTAFYKVGDFGIAGCWMTENLKDSTNTGAVYDTTSVWNQNSYAAYTYPNGNKANVATYGLLYTWPAVTKRQNVTAQEGYPSLTPITQGICPNGWHIPSDQEFSQLEMVIANDTAGLYSTHGYVTPWNDEYFTYDNTSVSRGTYAGKMVASADGGRSNPNTNTVTKRGINWRFAGRRSWSAFQGCGTQLWYNTASHSVNQDIWRRAFYSANGGVFRTADTGAYYISARCKKN